jgi:hydrogenase/urease accessory protein HupE
MLPILLVAAPARGHEVRPAYLDLREEATGEFGVLWKTPARGDSRLALSPELSGRTEVLTPVTLRRTGDAAVQTWRMRAIDPLRGQTIRIDGLTGTMTEALVRIEFADGTTWVKRLTPPEPAALIPPLANGWLVAGAYLELGVEHILTGVDHLLFILALVLISAGSWKLVQAVTAFTVAHSITLGLAALGFVHVPAAPVEAIIALSIAFVAAEIVRARRGRKGLAARAPWIAAFTFGLLHGFGFAGALSEIGLPQGHIPAALLFFNLGVEAGQLLFVAAVLSGTMIARRVRLRPPRWAALAPPYAIGCVAMFWAIQRVAAF